MFLIVKCAARFIQDWNSCPLYFNE